MSKRALWGLAALFALTPFHAAAQQPEPTVFTFVAEWDVPRDKWADASAFLEKTSRPIWERLVADGTLVSYGTFETVVHQAEGGVTHGTWWQATSFAAIEKARAEALKAPPSPAMSAAKHHDYLLRTVIGNRKPASGSGGYLWVSTVQVQPGKAATWRQLWEKYNKADNEALLANGTLMSYALEVQQVTTLDPNLRFSVFVLPNSDALDKARAQQLALDQKLTQVERDTRTLAFRDAEVAGSQRSYLARVTSYAFK